MADTVTPEIGHAQVSLWDGTTELDFNLQGVQAARTWSRLLREDDKCAEVYQALTLPIRRAAWQVDPNGAPGHIVARVAEDLRLPVRGEKSDEPVAPRAGRLSWSEHLEQLLLSLPYGVMFFEQVYRTDAHGEEHLVKLAPRPPGTITDITVARDGGLESITQAAAPGDETGPVTIPVDRLVAYVHRPLDTTWTGTSIFRPAWSKIVLRDRLLELEDIVAHRTGMGTPVYTASEMATKDTVAADMKAGLKIAQELAAGRGAGASLPPKAKLALVGTDGKVVDIRAIIEAHEASITKSVLAHFLNLDGQAGAYALADTQNDIFVQAQQTIADWIADTATQHVVEDLVRVAFPEHEGLCPRIVADPIASKRELSPEAHAQLWQSGALQDRGPVGDELRRRYSLPALGEEKGAGSEVETVVDDTTKSSDDLLKAFNGAGMDFRSGFDPVEALAEFGVEGIAHNGSFPITLKPHEVADAESEAAMEALEDDGNQS
ncbi:hypothetical protein EAH68_12770 [Corynebacterium hylobatis]|uniref:Phage portal protein n=1 Tax=Corynebacterium hylobatis TaxID=1859290 RepID=A0A3R9ZD14_9CORY|nr:hypothetical protein [Corynebacterium hylobatis]RSZ61530.1 hypothetical protein EAH68_12770 [Corynebacterium hylobatis]